MVNFCHIMVGVLFILMVVILKMLWDLNKKIKGLMTIIVKKSTREHEKINVDQCFTFEGHIDALRER